MAATAATVPDPIERKKPFPRGIPLLTPFICEQGEDKSLLLHPERMGIRKPDHDALLDCLYRRKGGSCPLSREDLLEEENTSMENPWLSLAEAVGRRFLGSEAARAAVDPFAKLSSLASEFAEEVILVRGFDGEVMKDVVLGPSCYNGTTNGPANISSGASLKKSFPEPEVVFRANSAVSAERVGVGRPEMASLVSGADASPIAGAEFILDSGSSVHVTGQKAMLNGYMRVTQSWKMAVADGRLLDVVGVGSITTSDGRFHIPNVFYVEGLKENLISVSQLDKYHGLFNGFYSGICETIRHGGLHGGEVVGGGFRHANGQYKLRFLLVPEN